MLTPHSSTATVIINIIDKNDHIPVIIGRKVSKYEMCGKINILLQFDFIREQTVGLKKI